MRLPEQGAENPAQRPVRVFLAEDNPADVRFVREMLDARGRPYELSVETDGLAAIDAFEHFRAAGTPLPDLVLLDINLPRRDGFEVLSHIRQSPSCESVPVSMITSSDLQRDRDRAIALGANDYVHKCFDLDEFTGNVLQLLDRLLPDR